MTITKNADGSFTLAFASDERAIVERATAEPKPRGGEGPDGKVEDQLAKWIAREITNKRHEYAKEISAKYMTLSGTAQQRVEALIVDEQQKAKAKG